MDDQENFIKAIVTYQDNNNYLETIYSDAEKILVSNSYIKSPHFKISSLNDINNLDFSTFDVTNYEKLNWDEINYSELNDDSKDAIDWAQVDFNKAIKSPTFDLDLIDWTELNSSKNATKAYKLIQDEFLSAPAGGFGLFNNDDLISPTIASNLDYSKIDFKKFSPSSLTDINDLNFDSLGKNYQQLKWDEINYSELNDDSKDAIDWAQVDLNKATKSENFTMEAVDWDEINQSKSAAKAYKAIDWENVSISSDVSANLDYSKVDFKKFSPSSLTDINDLNFDSLGKNYQQLKWDEINYSELNNDSKDAIDWTKVDFKKATKSENFTMEAVDWDEINQSKSGAKAYKAIDWENVSISSDVSAKLDYSKVDFKKFSPSSLTNINDLNFETLGKNYQQLKWDEINYSELNDDSKDAIDWTKVDFKKATKSENFTMEAVDWDEINQSKSGAKAYKAIDWENVSISSDVSAKLDYSKVDFKKFSPSSLDNINDLNFETLGKNYQQLKWDEINYSELNDDSKDAIDWAQVDLNKAIKSPTFDLDDIDWTELNSSKNATKAYRLIQDEYLSPPAGGFSLFNNDDLISPTIAF